MPRIPITMSHGTTRGRFFMLIYDHDAFRRYLEGASEASQ